jgi:hypothetical protein
MVLTIVYNTQNYRGFWTLFIVRYHKKENITFWKLDLFLSSDEVGRHVLLLGPLERANLSHWTTHISITTAVQIPQTRLHQREINGFQNFVFCSFWNTI